MGRDVPEHFSRREHCFVQSFFTILMFIGCYSVTTPAAATEVPALGGYVFNGVAGSTGYQETEAEAMRWAQGIAVGCAPIYPGGPTICYDPYEIVELSAWDSDPGAWTWWRVGQIRIPIRHYSMDGVNYSIDYYYSYFRIVLKYFCPSGYRMVEYPAAWQIGSSRPTCTDGLPTVPPPPPAPPPPASCSGQGGYTIRLQGPGGTNGALANVEPGNPVATLRANVSCAGQPASGKQIALAVDVITLSGGHQHDQGRRPQHSGTVSFNGSDTTDANGDVSFTFTAPAPAGDHTITAQCSDGSCGTDTGSVWVGIQGLEPIGSGPWELTGTKLEHPENHYLNVPAFLVLQQLGLQWRRLYVPFGPVFTVNDASLVRGGLFDCCETYTDSNNVVHNRQIEGWWTPPHVEHRRGTVVDINGIRREDEKAFEEYAAELDADAAIHGTGTGRHYHVRLMGVAE